MAITHGISPWRHADNAAIGARVISHQIATHSHPLTLGIVRATLSRRLNALWRWYFPASDGLPPCDHSCSTHWPADHIQRCRTHGRERRIFAGRLTPWHREVR